MLRLHEAWWAIAQSIAAGKEFWICNAANSLYRRNRISYKVREAICERVSVESVIQGIDISSLWRNLNTFTSKAQIARIQFISAELRRLSIPDTEWGAAK